MVKLFPILLLVGCASGLDGAASDAPLDHEYFRCNVQPVLAARCSYPACHGSALRPLSLYAPGRMRYGVSWDRPKEPMTMTELDMNFAVAGGFTSASPAGEPLLLAKPLDTSAGGYYHRGADLYTAGDVFMTKDDPGYQMLASWIAGASAAATCQPTTEVGP